MGLGMSLGFFLGIPLGFIMGVAIEDVSFGIIISPAIGCAIGCALGSILEAKHKENIRPLTESERKRKKLAVAIGLVFLIAGVITFSGLLYLRR
jgi:phosphate/sulfate permease